MAGKSLILGRTDPVGARNLGYKQLDSNYAGLPAKNQKEFLTFIENILKDFPEFCFDIYPRRNGNIILGEKALSDHSHGKRIISVNVLNATFLIPRALFKINEKAPNRKPISDYEFLKEKLTKRKTAVLETVKNSSSRRPFHYAPYLLETRDFTESEDDVELAVPPKIMREIAERRGKKLSNALKKTYGIKCCVTGCTVEDLLEGAHIIPHCKGGPDKAENGLLLRSDIHTLFDLHHLRVSEKGVVKISRELEDSEYEYLDGVEIKIPESVSKKGFAKAIKCRYELLANGS